MIMNKRAHLINTKGQYLEKATDEEIDLLFHYQSKEADLLNLIWRRKI